MVPWTTPGSYPTFSMMSISPLLGQPALPRSLPSIQKAGQTPRPRGILMRDSKWPYAWLKVRAVLSRADEYWHVPFQHCSPESVFLRAVITRWPSPSRAAFRLPGV